MLLQGILLGISLAFLVGPLLFTIVQAGLERGFRAGLAVGAGIWTSDMLYVAVVWRALEALTALTATPQFRLWSGLAGGALLVGFGLASFFSGKKIPPGETAAPTLPHSYAAYFFKGFLINTVNPFTVFFWLGIAGAMAGSLAKKDGSLLVFFGGMFGTLVLTDTLKAWAARHLRRFLTPKHLSWVSRGTGVALVVFGVVLVLRNLG